MPYIRGSKIAKGLQSVKYSFTVPEKPKRWAELARRSPLARAPGALKRGTLSGLSTFLSQNMAKVEEKNKIWRKTKFRKKSKKGGPFSLARYCMLRGKTGTPFWFSLLGQMVQFDTIHFRRTL